MYQFNVRVYGLLINDRDEILISDEQESGMQFSKFPGGGLEFGEGLLEGLRREFIEECNTEIEVVKHFYTTDFFIKSIFNGSQLVAVYYVVKGELPADMIFKTKPFDFDGEGDVLQSFRWMKIADLKKEHLTFQLDQHVVELLLREYELS